MSNRFERLFQLPANQYIEGSPVILAAGVLSKDTETGSIIAQLKFQSVSEKRIKAVKVSLTAYDIADTEIEGVRDYQYLEMDIFNGQEFGANKAIIMPLAITRSFALASIVVVFTNGTMWESNVPFERLPMVHPIGFSTAELEKQYRIEINNQAKYVPKKEKGIWQCACGTWNGGYNCTHCRALKGDVFAAFDCEMLTEKMRVRLAAEAEQKRIAAEKEEERRVAKELKKKRNKKIALLIILMVCSICMFVFATKEVIIPTIKYNDASEQLADGQYEDAIAAFAALGDFRNSKEMILECHYMRALSWVENAEYDAAEYSFEGKLKGYKNSKGMLDVISGLKMLANSNYEQSILLILQGNVAVEIRYNTNSDQSIESELYSTAEQFAGFSLPHKTGYKFAGWLLSAYGYTAGGNVVVEFDATWTDGYTIRYNLDGGSAQNPAEYRKDGAAIVLRNPTRQGYSFVGWTGTDLNEITMNVTIPSGSYGDREYTANWKANNYTFTLDANGGKVDTASFVAAYEGTYTLPIPVRDYYEFLGWYCNSVKYEGNMWRDPKDVELVAQWKPITYTIDYVLSGGFNAPYNVKTYTFESDEIVLQNPTKAGYRFVGWYSDGEYRNEIRSIEAGSHGNMTLYAKWEMETYTITYHLNGGTNSSQNVSAFNIESAKITLQDPTRTGYKFLGWYKDSGYQTKIMEIPKGSYGDLNLYAKWEAVRYTITYNLAGGTNSTQNPGYYTIDDQITLKDPTKNGYKFLGWYSDSSFKTKVTQIAKGSQENVTLYAKWEIITYTITYQLNGGQISGTKITSFTVKDLPVNLPTATKAGLAFTNWSKDSNDGKSIDQITQVGEVTVIAHYMDPALKLTLSNDGTYYYVTSYSGTATHLDIPAYYKGMPVKEIGKRSSYSYSTDGLFGSSLISVTIPDTVIYIGDNAFKSCYNLTTVDMSNSVVEIGEDAFWYCQKLKSISFPNTLKTVGGSAFGHCISLEEIVLPDSVTYLGAQTFTGCNSLKKVRLSNSLTAIEHNTFCGCTQLTSVNIPEGVKSIGWKAFQGCSSLTKIIIPLSVTEMGTEWDSVFGMCKKLTIYCRASIIPEGWHEGWNAECEVVWGYTGN